MRTVYARGHGTEALARLLDSEAVRVQSELTVAAIEHRPDLLVARRIASGQSLLPLAAPRDLEPEQTDRVIAAVGGGPHSELAARVAHAVATALSVPSRMIMEYQEGTSPEEALATVEELSRLVPDIDYLVLPGRHVQDLLDAEGEQAMLVLGAPGGSFIQRQYFGPGARLIARAPVGAVVVQSAPRRVFHAMEEAQWVGRHLSCRDALALHDADRLPVVEGGAVVGVVTRAALEVGGRDQVEAVMEDTSTVGATEALEDVDLSVVHPVLHDGRLVGLVGGAG